MKGRVDRSLDYERLDYVGLRERKSRIPQLVCHVLPEPRDQIVDTHNLVPLGEQPLTEVRADESRSTGDNNAHPDDSLARQYEVISGPSHANYSKQQPE